MDRTEKSLGFSEVDTACGSAFWSLANVICGFAVVQMITYLLALGADQSKICRGVTESRLAVILGMVICSAGYAWLVHVLAKSHREIVAARVAPATAATLVFVGVMRQAAIVAACALGVLVTGIVECR